VHRYRFKSLKIAITMTAIKSTTRFFCTAKYRALGYLTALLFGIGCPLAFAEMTQASVGDGPLSLTFNGSSTHRSNLFRRPDSVNPSSDAIKSTSATMNVDKSYSQQHVAFSMTRNATRYERFSYLDLNSTNYRGEWQWKATSWLSATVSTDRSSSLAPFEDTLGTSKNEVVNNNRSFSLDGKIFGGLNLLLDVSTTDQKTDQVITTKPDLSSLKRQLSVRYATRAGNSITVSKRYTTGASVDFTTFKQDDIELGGTWHLTEKSDLSGKLGRRSRSYSTASRQQFSGTSAEIGYTWRPASRLSLNIVSSRTSEPIQDVSFSHNEIRKISISPVFELGPRTSTYVRFNRSIGEYQGSGSVASLLPPRKDTAGVMEIGLSWAPLQSVYVSTNLQRFQRASNQSAFEYEDNVANVNASWKF